MKSGQTSPSIIIKDDGTTEAGLEYWVLPNKPMGKMTTRATLVGGWQDVDHDALVRQTESIKCYLNNTLESNTWVEQNDRFYFKNKEDWELFKTMCLIGWQ